MVVLFLDNEGLRLSRRLPKHVLFFGKSKEERRDE